MDEGTERSREEAIKRLVSEYEAKLRTQLKIGPQTFDDIEEQAQIIGESIKESIVDEVTKECGSGYVGTRALCVCGRRGKYKQTRTRQVIGLHGVTSIERACYYCSHCRDGFCPLDVQMGLGSGQCSRRVQALMARFSSFLPFELAAREIETICGIKLSATTIQRYAKQIGARLQAEWAKRQAQLWLGRVSACAEHPSRLYTSMDGAIIHVGGEWREAKLGAVYRRSDEGVAWAQYYATMENSAKFGPKLRTLAFQHGAQHCRDLVVVADGAPWIWQEVGKYFPQSVQVLDYYHVTQHLWEIADARFGPAGDLAKAWMEEQKSLLLSDQIDRVTANVDEWQARKLLHRDLKRKLVSYLTTHRHRALYQTFAKKGYHIGSGIIEAGCKTVVKSRMGGAGMRWEKQGAEAMLQICAHWRSSGATDFMPYTN